MRVMICEREDEASVISRAQHVCVIASGATGMLLTSSAPTCALK